jgi:hypothetical protein
MATDTTSPDSSAPNGNDTVIKTTAVPAGTFFSQPVLVVETRKKRRRSRKLKDSQDLHRGFSKASTRVSRAVAQGLDEYLRRSDKSAEKKKDGALRDLMVNLSRGLSKAIRKSSDAPVDITRTMNSKRTQRRMRKIAKALAPPGAR